LIARADRDLVREVTAADAFGSGEQLVDRSGNRSRERQPHHERHDLDNQEQRGDDGEQQQEKLPEIEVVDAAERRS
jgi:hypothetical protein